MSTLPFPLKTEGQSKKVRTPEVEADSSISVPVKDFSGEQFLKKRKFCCSKLFFCCARVQQDFSLAELDIQYIILNYIQYRNCL